jgi:hypothetical protein
MRVASRIRPSTARPSTKSSCAGSAHSFAPGTGVLLADGSVEPIEDVDVGDEILATNPDTGETSTRKVSDLHTNLDTRLTTLTVATPDGQQQVIHTTQNHPFWSATEERWVPAGQLQAGHRLRTPDMKSNDAGSRAEALVVSVENFGGAAIMHDLTIADIHTYHVVAGNAPVLVHDCDPDSSTQYDKHQFMPDHESRKRFLPRVGSSTANLNSAGQRLLDDITHFTRGDSRNQ